MVLPKKKTACKIPLKTAITLLPQGLLLLLLLLLHLLHIKAIGVGSC